MQHRHLNTQDWNLEAIDSALERGNLPDWRDLFACAKSDESLARDILKIADWRPDEGSHVLARHLVARLWPALVPASNDES